MSRARDLADSADKDIAGTLTVDGLTVAGNVSVDGGTVKLDGNYPVGTGNVALGNAALDDASLTGGNNTAIGNAALTANTTGANNTVMGSASLVSNTTGINNAVFGYDAMELNTTGGHNTAVGAQSLYNNTTASNNTSVGYRSLFTNTTGEYNQAFGDYALYTNNGSHNHAFGRYALRYNTSGTYNDAFGYATLENNTTGQYNVAYGSTALRSNTTASYNTAVGYQASYSNTTGINTAIGQGSLYSSTTGTSNTSVGKNTLGSNTTGINNTAVGYQAGYTNTTGSQNTCIGHQAGYTYNGSQGYNTFIGRTSGYSATTGYYNTFVGGDAGYWVTNGNKNTILGMYNGNQGGLDIRTSSNNIVLSDGDGNPRLSIFSAGQVHIPGNVASPWTNGGIYLGPSGEVNLHRSGAAPLYIKRSTSEGHIVQFNYGGSVTGAIGTRGSANRFYVAASNFGFDLEASTKAIRPTDAAGNSSDNVVDIGRPDVRYDDICATNGTIVTSDRNEKQDIAPFTTEEKAVAARLSELFRTYRWISSVEEKGESARTHSGIIAQDVQAAFEAEGLDAGKYALFISHTWWEADVDVPAVEADEEKGTPAQDAYTYTEHYLTAEEAPEGATERTRLGIRYPELLSFIAAYNDQRFADIEARITALEGN